MAKKRQNKRVQNSVNNIDAGNFSPSYDTASRKINTNETIKNKKGKPDLHLCKCNDKPLKTKTWDSILNMYGDADTTEVWDSSAQEAKIVFSPKTLKTNKFNEIPEQNKNPQNKTNNRKSKINKKKYLNKKSIISFYRKRKTRVKNLDENKPDAVQTKELPVIQFNVNKNPKRKTFFHDGKGDACAGGPCTNVLSDYYKKQISNGNGDKPKIIKQSNNKNKEKLYVNKNIKEDNVNNKIVKDKLPPQQVSTRNYSIKGLLISSENIICKCKDFLKHSRSNKMKNTEPSFVMKVDSTDMRVLNSSEIKNNVKRLGKIRRNRSCICPSRMKRLIEGNNNVCEKGICESALRNHSNRFNCKCMKKADLLVCQDSTCDVKGKNRKKTYLLPSENFKDQIKPMAEVVIDHTNMNILNSDEMRNLFKNGSKTEICPTGICRRVSKDPKVELKCKCLRKKITHRPLECTNKTCGPKKCALSNLCSRVFSKSEYWSSSDRRKHMHRNRPLAIQTKVKKIDENQNIKAKSENIDKRILTQFYREEQDKRLQDLWYKCYCECKQQNITRNKIKKKKTEIIKKRKKRSKKKGKSKILQQLKSLKNITRKRHNQESNVKGNIIKCLKRKQVRCENKLKEKEKEFVKNEKKADKKEKELQKLDKKNKAEEYNWNCLTNLFSGVINLGVQLIKEVFTAVFSILLNPIGSYVYVRERAMDPEGTLQKIKTWLLRSWKNKSSKVSQTVKESDTINVIADQIEDSAVYNALFANKGKTREEKLHYERKRRLRKRRIQKRQDQALYGCRHMLLTTMRKTPCIWFYHICPDLYPQCLSLVNFMRNFFHIIIYLAAFICWTPCIVTFEMCRAFLCCFFCTH